MKRLFLRFLVILLFLTQVPFLKANGFAVFDISARAATLGGAFTARADDSSALYYNLGGMGFLGGLRFKANLMFNRLTTKASFPDIDRTFKSNPTQYRGAYFVAWHFADRFTLGLGGFNPYFFQFEMPWNWPGSLLNIESNFSAVYVRPAFGIKLFENLSVGFGVDFVSVRTKWLHGQIFPLPNSLTHGRIIEDMSKTKGSGTGFAAGALWKIHKRIQFGVRYQHKVKVELEGEDRLWASDSYEIVEVPDLREFPMSLTKLRREFRIPYPVTSQITLPAEFSAGLMVVPWDRLMLHVDFCWKGWSEFGDWRFSALDPEADLNRNFYDLYLETYGVAPAYGSQGLALDWKDVWSVKFGLEFKLSQVLGIRSGYSFNPSAIQNQAVEPITADLDQHILSFGIGYEGPLFSIWDFEEQGGFSFDAFLQYRLSKELQSSLPGFELVYNTDRLVFGVGIGLTF